MSITNSIVHILIYLVNDFQGVPLCRPRTGAVGQGRLLNLIMARPQKKAKSKWAGKKEGG